ncbi:MAG TPA: enoyl-CoA hydratase-related protein [Steroidobacteraceae bacterium]|jgi:enoyl-CoA hydratase/carnithine racemase
MTDTREPTVVRSVNGRIATITLNRPEKRNAFSSRVFDELRENFVDLPDEVRAVILTGAGEHFCAGLDLAEHKASPPCR